MSERFPKQIRYIVGNEACERFSFYGMRSILTIFMVNYLAFTETKATAAFHFFVSLSYFTPFLGAYLSDRYLGKYKTILYLSCIYCLGHLVLAVWENQEGLYWGLGLIALGSGGIKPCVSAHVGDQFTQSNQHLLEKVFSLFYFSINFGSFFSTLIIPLTLQWYGPSIAFGIPGILMFMATVIFWMGRKSYVHVAPQKNAHGLVPFVWRFFRALISKGSWSKAKKACFDSMGEEEREALVSVGRVTQVFASLCLFWSLYEQHSSTWVLQARFLEQQMSLFGFSFRVLPSQMQVLNPLFILCFVPLFSLVLYPWAQRKGLRPTKIRKMGLGLLISASSFVPIALIQWGIEQGQSLSISVQVVPYIMMTAAEVLISVTALEFAYTQSPPSMKSTMTAVWLLTISVGNLLTGSIEAAAAQLGLAEELDRFILWSALGFVFCFIYTVFVRHYQVKNYVLSGEND